MFEEYDFDSIMADMIGEIDEDIDTREGSVIYDAIAPMALELSTYYAALEMVMNEVFADSASYYYLIKRAAERGVFPKEATNAVLKLQVSPASSVITVGDVFGLEDMEYNVTSVIDASQGLYQVQCTTEGVEGNQQLGDVLPIDTADELNDLETATLTEVLVPGEDDEDVETLRERYFESFIERAFAGNKQSYLETVNAIDGVGSCKVIRQWKGGYNPSDMIVNDAVTAWFNDQSASTLGAEVYEWLSKIYNASLNKLLTVGGTIKVIILSSENKAPSDELVEEVQETLDPPINSGEGVGLAPIGHVVNVVGAKTQRVNYAFTIIYQKGYSYDAVADAIKGAVDAYHDELTSLWSGTENTVIKTNQIGARLLELEHIEDVAAVRINGKAENLVLDEEYIPVRGNISG